MRGRRFSAVVVVLADNSNRSSGYLARLKTFVAGSIVTVGQEDRNSVGLDSGGTAETVTPLSHR